MSPKFGTSGLRGLVTELTPDLVTSYVQAFLRSCDVGSKLYVGRDLRPSSPNLADVVMTAAQNMGMTAIDAGQVPTPALALTAQQQDASAIMITGSHIPADRNGLKFYSRAGEITKKDETAICAALEKPLQAFAQGQRISDPEVNSRYVLRYVTAFGSAALAGKRIGLYSHSAVGRDVLASILRLLGAEVTELGRSETFIPVDTEAVDSATRDSIRTWVQLNGFDAVMSMDGDSDRPLLADENGKIVPGDIMGQITAEALDADTVVTPISSNSGVSAKSFANVHLTRIGSPFVIAGMEAAGGKVIGYEANGGFLLGFEATALIGTLLPLITRDCVLPLIMTLVAAGDGPVSQRVAHEPRVITVADRLQDVPQVRSSAFVGKLAQDPEARARFLAALGSTERKTDLTDGVRMYLTDGRVVHVRPSGNAPELRLYVEAQDEDAANATLALGLDVLRSNLA